MIVDSSALVAIVSAEPERPALLDALDHAPQRKISAGTLLEASIVVDGRPDPYIRRKFDTLLLEYAFRVVPVDEEQALIARAAYRDFGRGSGHPARLNFGDCYAYALASVTDEPLLYKGNDFSHTDLRSALD